MGTERSLKLARALVFTVAAALAFAAPVQAQGVVSSGQSVSGRLDASDFVRENDNTYYDDWFYEGRAGEVITVTLSPTGFRPWLILGTISSGTFVPEEYSGANSGNDVRLTYTIPSTGRYVVRVNVMGARNGGPYTLRVDKAGGGGSAARSSGTITPGSTISGMLQAGDMQTDSGWYHDDYAFSGTIGQVIHVDLESDGFDAYLDIYDTDSGRWLVGDDDGGEGLNSRIAYTLPSTGQYTICARSRYANRSGSYTLTLRSSGAGGSGGASGAPGYIALNQVVSGQLDSSDPTMGDGTSYDMWRFIGLAGQRIRITMRSSDFDSYMTIGSFATGSYEYIKGDDDSGGGNDSMIEFTLPAAGEYGIRANSMGRASGRYTITVQAF